VPPARPREFGDLDGLGDLDGTAMALDRLQVSRFDLADDGGEFKHAKHPDFVGIP